MRTRNRNTHDQTVEIQGPYARNTDEFEDFLKNILKLGGVLPWLCTDELRKYTRYKGGLISKIDDRFKLYRSGVKRTDGCFQVLAFLLFKVETDESDKNNVLYVNSELVCRGIPAADAKLPETRGQALHDRFQKDMLIYANKEKIEKVIFSLDSVESAMKTYQRWGYSNVLYKKNNKRKKSYETYETLEVNTENGAIPMVKIFVKGSNINPEDYSFICNMDKVDFKKSIYPIETIVNKKTRE